MFCNRLFVVRKYIGSLQKISFRFNNSSQENFFCDIRRFRNDAFLDVKKRSAATVKCIDEKLTYSYSTGVFKGEDNLKCDRFDSGVDEEENNLKTDCLDNGANQQQSNESLFKEISDGDPEIEKKLKVIEFEIALFTEERGNLPIYMKKKDWIELLECQTQFKRHKMYTFLFLCSRKSENSMKKKKKKHEMYLMMKEKMDEECPNVYGLSANTMFMRIYDTTLNKLLNFRLIDALLFSQHIIFDCSYDSFMTKMNSKFCAKQLVHAYASNRLHQAPFHVKFCNVNKNDATMNYLRTMLPGIFNETFLWDIHEESYLNLYPKEKLVYLTPHAKHELFQFNHEDIYIIGAYVDRGTGKKMSLAKAKESNLRMAKLPLDNFLTWRKGLKSLPINIVLDIMLDMRLFNDWNIALKNVPNRFLTANE